jgi:hypothetical protein
MTRSEIAFTFLLLFALAGMILASDKAISAFGKWRERRAIEKRNALQERYGMKSFRGVKEFRHDDIR